MSNYATKFYLKGVTDINMSEFPKKVDLASLKSKVDQTETKLKPVPTDLSNLTSVVKNDLVKNTTFDELVKNQ